VDNFDPGSNSTSPRGRPVGALIPKDDRASTSVAVLLLVGNGNPIILFEPRKLIAPDTSPFGRIPGIIFVALSPDGNSNAKESRGTMDGTSK